MAPEILSIQVIASIRAFCSENKIPAPTHHGVNSHTYFKDLVGDLLPQLLIMLSSQFSISLAVEDLSGIKTIKGLVNVIIDKRRDNAK